MFVWFDSLRPINNFSVKRDKSSLVEPVLSYDKCVLLKDHNTVTPVRLKPAAPLSRVKHSTTALPLDGLCLYIQKLQDHYRIFHQYCQPSTSVIQIFQHFLLRQSWNKRSSSVGQFDANFFMNSIMPINSETPRPLQNLSTFYLSNTNISTFLFRQSWNKQISSVVQFDAKFFLWINAYKFRKKGHHYRIFNQYCQPSTSVIQIFQHFLFRQSWNKWSS